MKTNVLLLLNEWVNQRPGLDFQDYGDSRSYRAESREITADLHDYRELYSLASTYVENLAEKVENHLSNTSDRLTLKNGKLEYCVGQYFPTEYRPAASRILVSLLWRQANQNHPEWNGHEIRAYFKKRLSRRVARNYFS